VFSLQTVPARAAEARKGVVQYGGFSLHAGIGVEAEQREKLERLTRYVSRPLIAIERFDLTAQGAGPLPIEDAVPRRHDAHRARALGLHRSSRGAGAAATDASHEIPRRVREAAPTTPLGARAPPQESLF
jgi:hypothetical protein